MLVPRSRVVAFAAAAVGLAACGTDAQSAHCTPRASPPPPTITAGQLTATADRAVVPTGGSVAVAVHATGPFTYQAPCDAPLSMLVVDSADIHVYSSAPAAPKGTPCGAVTLGASQGAEYDVLWTPDTTLPPGRYRLVLALGDQPQLVLGVQLGTTVSGCG